jgi:hypothetical protein
MLLEALVKPRSIAILGASELASIGRALIDSCPSLLGRLFDAGVRDLLKSRDVVTFCISCERTSKAFADLPTLAKPWPRLNSRPTAASMLQVSATP